MKQWTPPLVALALFTLTAHANAVPTALPAEDSAAIRAELFATVPGGVQSFRADSVYCLSAAYPTPISRCFAINLSYTTSGIAQSIPVATLLNARTLYQALWQNGGGVYTKYFGSGQVKASQLACHANGCSFLPGGPEEKKNSATITGDDARVLRQTFGDTLASSKGMVRYQLVHFHPDATGHLSGTIITDRMTDIRPMLGAPRAAHVLENHGQPVIPRPGIYRFVSCSTANAQTTCTTTLY